MIWTNRGNRVSNSGRTSLSSLRVDALRVVLVNRLKTGQDCQKLIIRSSESGVSVPSTVQFATPSSAYVGEYAIANNVKTPPSSVP